LSSKIKAELFFVKIGSSAIISSIFSWSSISSSGCCVGFDGVGSDGVYTAYQQGS